MKNRPSLRFCIPLLCFGLFLSWCPSASALLITFDDSGYVAGNNLTGSGPSAGPKWDGGGADFKIAAAEGFSGTQGAAFSTKASGNANTILPLGATALPGFNGSSSLLEVSFQFRFLETPTSGQTGTSAVLNLGYTAAGNAVRFGIWNNGMITYSAHSNSTSRVATGFQVTDTTIWTTVTALLDYQTQTYTFSINGTPFVTEEPLLFASTSSISVASLRLQNVGNASHHRIVFDNIQLTVIPEPSAMALLLPGLGLLGWAKHRSLRSTR